VVGHSFGGLLAQIVAGRGQKRNKGVTEIVEIPDRGHALTIDGGWRKVADTALGFVKRFVS
jgi:hypothetical protein